MRFCCAKCAVTSIRANRPGASTRSIRAWSGPTARRSFKFPARAASARWRSKIRFSCACFCTMEIARAGIIRSRSSIPPALDLMNVRYVLAPSADLPRFAAFPKFRHIASLPGTELFENTAVLPRFFFVQQRAAREFARTSAPVDRAAPHRSSGHGDHSGSAWISRQDFGALRSALTRPAL